MIYGSMVAVLLLRRVRLERPTRLTRAAIEKRFRALEKLTRF